MKIFIKICFVFALLLTTFHSWAAHIIGGDVYYKCVNLDTVRKRTTFDIFFTMYRDKLGGGAEFDADAEFGLFRSDDGGISWIYTKSVIVPPKDKGNVGYDNPCIIVPPNIGVEKAVYEFSFDLDWGNAIYQIAYQRCCRNGTISNIYDSGSTGAVFSIEINGTAIASCNNSPVYKKFPPIVICSGEQLKFDHSASDEEGDQIVYELCAPLQSGGRDGESGQGDASSCTGVRPSPLRCLPPYREVDFLLPTYSATNPIGGNPIISINNATGLITGTPYLVGQYVVGVCAREYRDGKLLSTVRRDFQFNVTQCQLAVKALIRPDEERVTSGYVEYTREGDIYKIKSCGSKFIPFINESENLSTVKRYRWKLDIGIITDSLETENLDYTFADYGKYTGSMIVNPDQKDCSDTAYLEIEILPGIQSAFEFDYDTCIAGPITFTDQSKAELSTLQKWNWDFGTDTSQVRNPSYEYKTPGTKEVILTTIDNNQCRSTITKKIDYLPVPALLVVEPTQFTGCLPANIFFENLSYPIDSTYLIEWQFGDGNSSGEISPSNLYDSIGLFDVSLKITSPIGCVVQKNYPDLIEVLESPQAAFSYTPEKLNFFASTATFTNNSLRENYINWDFGGLGNAISDVANFTFPDTGLYNVTLYAFHKNGCVDTTSALIDVEPVTNLIMPNAFTPNNDGLNDSFKGYGYTKGISGYKMTIWNRWGEEIYTSLDPTIGWNGAKDNTGSLSPQGVYVYLVDYVTSRGEKKSLKGHLTLIR